MAEAMKSTEVNVAWKLIHLVPTPPGQQLLAARRIDPALIRMKRTISSVLIESRLFDGSPISKVCLVIYIDNTIPQKPRLTRRAKDKTTQEGIVELDWREAQDWGTSEWYRWLCDTMTLVIQLIATKYHLSFDEYERILHRRKGASRS
jgi:hypothetical protein